MMHLHYSHTGNEIFKTFLPSLALNEKKNIRLTKICEKGRKDHIFVSFRNFPSKCKKAVSFHKWAFLRNFEIFVYDSWT